jgi:hypothetical protein
MKEMLLRSAMHEKFRDTSNANKSQKTNSDEVSTSFNSTSKKRPILNPSKPRVLDEKSDNNAVAITAPSTTTETTGTHRQNNITAVTATTSGQSNFLSIGAKRAKLARSARTAARVRTTSVVTTVSTISHTGSGESLQHVIKLKFVKGFTQAVRTPCSIEELI